MSKKITDKLSFSGRQNGLKKPKQGLLYNRKFVIALSVLLSITLWVAVTLNIKQMSSNVYQDIIIDVQTVDRLELVEIRGPSSLTDRLADVTVAGDIYTLSQVTRDDIAVAAVPTGTISQPGVYRLSLTASCLSSRDVTLSFTGGESYITARFDYTKTAEFEIDDIITSGASVNSENGLVIAGAYSNIQKVKVSGPETEINRISHVDIISAVDTELSSTSEFKGRIAMMDENGEELSETVTQYISVVGYNDVEGEPTEDEIIVTVPVYKIATLPAEVTFKKLPNGFDLSTLKWSVEPDRLMLEGGVDTINALIEEGKFTVSEGADISKLTLASNRQKLMLNLNSGLFEVNGTESVDVVFDLSGYAERTVTLDREKCSFMVINVPDGLEVQIIDTVLDPVTVIGPGSSIVKLLDSGFTVVVDMNNVDSAPGQKTVNAIVNTNSKDCWAAGKYQLKILVTEKSS